MRSPVLRASDRASVEYVIASANRPSARQTRPSVLTDVDLGAPVAGLADEGERFLQVPPRFPRPADAPVADRDQDERLGFGHPVAGVVGQRRRVRVQHQRFLVVAADVEVVPQDPGQQPQVVGPPVPRRVRGDGQEVAALGLQPRRRVDHLDVGIRHLRAQVPFLRQDGVHGLRGRPDVEVEQPLLRAWLSAGASAASSAA